MVRRGVVVRKAFITVVAMAATLVVAVGAQAEKPQTSITCAAYPGDTVIDHGGGASVTLHWFDSNGNPTVPAGFTTVHLPGHFSTPTPNGAVRYDASVDQPGGLSFKTVGSCT